MTTENTSKEFNLRLYIEVATERAEIKPFNIDKTIKDILDEFPKVTDNQFKKAIRNGSLGKYGVSYRLSTQQICFWIREYIKENKSNLGI